MSTGTDCISKNPKLVEEQLRKVCRRLNETEVNIELFRRMLNNGVATNDVRNFVSKQSEMKKATNKYDLKLSKGAMKGKLSDACALALRLRQSKRRLKNSLIDEFNYPKSKCRAIMSRNGRQNTYHRTKHKTKAIAKYKHCERKIKKVCNEKNIADIPHHVWEVLKNVKIFNEDLEQEPPADPMICDNKIKLNSEEMAFLRRGPRFMMRLDPSLTDFQVQLEKMIALKKYDAANKGEDEDSGFSSNEDDDDIDVKCEAEMAKASMIYDKGSKQLDLGKMKATNYK